MTFFWELIQDTLAYAVNSVRCVNGESVRGVFLHPLAQRLFCPNDRLSDIPECIVQIKRNQLDALFLIHQH